MKDPRLELALDAFVPSFATEPGDWADVMARARRPVYRRPLVLVAALVGVLAVVLATPAFGVGERLYDFIVGKQAPPEVRKVYPPFFRGDARGVMQILTSAGPVTLWLASAHDGGPKCPYLQIGTARPRRIERVSCGGFPLQPIPGIRVVEPALTAVVNEFGNGLRLTSGRAASRIHRVGLRYSDDSVQRLRLAQGYFLGEVPRGKTPAEVRGYASGGALVAKVRILPPREAPPAPILGPAILTTKTSAGLHISLHVGSPAKSVCLVWEKGDEGGPVRCGSFSHGPAISLLTNPVGADLLVAGRVGAGVVALRRRLDVRDVRTVPLVNGYFLYDVAPGDDPGQLIAVDGDGKVLGMEYPS